jgi:hypothetical protein
MSQANRTVSDFEPRFHSVSHYNSPEDVLNDVKLSIDERRVILSSWASDMYAVESHPGLRKVPGISHRLRLHDILAALKQLDDETDPPPRGGMAMRLPRFSEFNCAASDEPRRFIGEGASRRHGHVIARRTPRGSRWTREENVTRYRKLLQTRLTDMERKFVERRLAEELRG